MIYVNDDNNAFVICLHNVTCNKCIKMSRLFKIMMTSSNENISVLLSFCEGNPPVIDGFSSQRPATRSFDAFFDLRLNKRLSKQSSRWWFETQSRSSWRHSNALHGFIGIGTQEHGLTRIYTSPVSIVKQKFQVCVPITNIIRSRNRLIFIMDIPISLYPYVYFSHSTRIY